MSTAAVAAVDPPSILTPADETKTRGFVGLSWSFGATKGPEVVLGVARVKTKLDGDAHGAKASLHFGLSNGIKFSKAKVVGVTGKSDRMGEFGLGYGSGSAFVTIGAWAPHLNLGGDFDFNGNFNGYIGANTLKKWDKPPKPKRPDI